MLIPVIPLPEKPQNECSFIYPNALLWAATKVASSGETVKLNRIGWRLCSQNEGRGPMLSLLPRTVRHLKFLRRADIRSYSQALKRTRDLFATCSQLKNNFLS